MTREKGREVIWVSADIATVFLAGLGWGEGGGDDVTDWKG